MSSRSKFNFRSSIIEVYDTGMEDEPIYLTVSKERWDEDHIQFVIPRRIAKAIGLMLQGEEE